MNIKKIVKLASITACFITNRPVKRYRGRIDPGSCSANCKK